jgi:hypothetical protein
VDYRVWKLNFGGGPTVAGDFNRNGVVDAADYTVWRDNLGTVYMPNDYDKWKMNFGNSSAGGSAAAQIAVPEPATWLLLIGLVAHNRAARRGKVRRAP